MAKYRCRAQPHGPHQIEFKIRYPTAREARVRYQFDLYVFLPAQLRVRDGYTSRRFIDDVVSYIRHTSPRIPLARLADPGFADSPLRRVESELRKAGEGRPIDAEALTRELRTFGNAFRAAVRTERDRVLRKASGAGSPSADVLDGTLAAMTSVLEAARRLPAAAVAAGLDGRLLTAARWTDEWTSLNAEAELVRIWDGLRERRAPGEALESVRARIRGESAHRREAGYLSVVRAGDPIANERAVHHESLLKKWSQGALYMSSEQLATSRGIGHIVAGIAAAAAMSFAVAATFLAQQLFASYSVPWALMIVVGYIFKDRMKEVLRGSLGRLFPLLFFDRSGRLIDQNVQGSVGTTRETVRFVDPSGCPRDVVAARDAAGNPFAEILPADDVIHYNRIVKLLPVRGNPAPGDAGSITEIVRVKTDAWLREMDDSTSRMRMVWGASVASVAVRRVYHAHMVLALSSSLEQRSLSHYLVVMSRDGVHRIQPLQAEARQAEPVSREESREAGNTRR